MRKKPILIILIYNIYFFLFIKVNGVLIFCIFYAIANHKCLIWLIVFLKNTWLNRSKAFKKDYQLGADLIVYVNLLWFHEFHKIKIQKKKYIPSARECHWHRDRGDPWLFHCRFPGRKLQCEMLCYYPCFVAFWQTWFGIFVELVLIQSLILTNGENPVWKRKIMSFIKTHLIQRIHQLVSPISNYESTNFLWFLFQVANYE